MTDATDRTPTRRSTLEIAEHWAVIVATLVALVGLAVTTYQNRLATEVQNRAWIYASDIRRIGPVADNQRIRIQVEITNVGETPAYDVESQRFAILAASQPTPDWSTIDSRQQQTLFPGAKMRLETSGESTLGGPTLFHAGKTYIWYLGRLTYTDAFDKPHWIELCFYQTRDEPDYQFLACPEGQNSDR